jgi:signal transduction histidine kinase
MLEARDIAWTFEVGEDGGVKLSPERRRHVLLVFQEAINNVVRHAHARRVAMRRGVHGSKLEAEIIDDGRGIEAAGNGDSQSREGRGLSNMRSRARDLGGALTVTTGDDGGTRVHLFVPVH